MATILHGNADAYVESIKRTLDDYEQAHAGARCDVYRQNSASIRIRVVDDRFSGMSRADRHDHVYGFLAQRLDDDTLSEISVLLTFAPAELTESLANLDFERPLPSKL